MCAASMLAHDGFAVASLAGIGLGLGIMLRAEYFVTALMLMLDNCISRCRYHCFCHYLCVVYSRCLLDIDQLVTTWCQA
jgi:hypothetical protein